MFVACRHIGHGNSHISYNLYIRKNIVAANRATVKDLITGSPIVEDNVDMGGKRTKEKRRKTTKGRM